MKAAALRPGSHRVDRRRVGVNRPHVEPALQEERQIPTGAAPGIEHASSPVEPAAQQLIEQIDIDLAELGAQVGGGRSRSRRHTQIIRVRYP
jgi:hypothetical protein